MFVPFFFHWYNGLLPPLVGVAVKVTGVPAQTGFVDATIETEAGTVGFTVTVWLAELVHPLALVTVTL